MSPALVPTPPPPPPPARFAIVTLVDGRRFGARVREVSLAGHRFVRCVVLSSRSFALDCAPTQIATLTWCSLDEATAASPAEVIPAELRRAEPTTSPPPAVRGAEVELIEFDDDERVWLAVARAQARALGVSPAELATDLGGEDVEVRAETVAFHVAASDDLRVRASLEARGIDVAPVCSRCGCTEDRRCPGGCAWRANDRTRCDRCEDRS